MIPAINRDTFISKIRKGYTATEACGMANVNRRALYRLLKDDASFKSLFDEAVAYANGQILDARREDDERARDLTKVKLIVRRKRD